VEIHIMFFLYNKNITFKGSYNFQYFLEGGTNPLVYMLQPEGSYNSLDSPAPTGRRLQPPFLTPSFP
jgi:hypothetical protein